MRAQNNKPRVAVKIFAVSMLLLQCCFPFAMKQEQTISYYSKDMKPASARLTTDSVITTARLASIIDTNRNRLTERPGVKNANVTLSLFVNPDLAVPYGSHFTATVQGCVQLISPNGTSGFGTEQPFTLTIQYDPAAGVTYKHRDAITFNPTIYTLVRCKVSMNGSALTVGTPDSIFRFEIHSEGEVFYAPPAFTGSKPVIGTTDLNSAAQVFTLNWQYLRWAEYYELEYLHVDDYAANGTSRERGTLKYDFKKEAVRIRVYTNTYELPLVFEQGYLVYRVRGVGITGSSLDIAFLGEWSLSPDAGTIPEDRCVYRITAALAHEADRLNWQYNSTFNESGMRSEAIAYADATSRARQQIVSATEDNKVVVQETLYDHAGRPAITTLPAPVRPESSALRPSAPYDVTTVATPTTGSITLPRDVSPSLLSGVGVTGYTGLGVISTHFGISPAILNDLQVHLDGFDLPEFAEIFRYRVNRARLGFVPRFNVNAEGRNFSRTNYDGETSACDEQAVIFGAQSGAGKYYSSQNEERARWQAFVPDAEGYPYMQVKYANDGTGQVKESSLPGAVHRSGGGKTQRYFYGSPSQQELNRYFGSDAGRASFYRKTLLLDENGQAHVKITDLKGNLVLSALTGTQPDNLEVITGASQMSITLNLVEENNVLNESDHSWTSTKRIALAARTTAHLTYEVQSPAYSDRYCTHAALCYDCVYDVEVSVTDNCGIRVYHRTSTVGNLADIVTCSSHIENFDTTLELHPGTYLIAKKLTVNTAAAEAYAEDFRSKFTCRNDETIFLPDADAACNPACNRCNLFSTTGVVRRRDGSNPSFAYTKRAAGNSESCVRACAETGLNEIDMAYQTMLIEVSPSGQYGEYRDTFSRDADNPLGRVNADSFLLSVFNDVNLLPLANANWRNPFYNYQTKTGADAYVLIGADGLQLHRSPVSEIVVRDGRQYVLPKYLNDLSDFINAWEPQWAEALVVYHPEYEYYLWNRENALSFHRDSMLRVTDTLLRATALGITDYNSDPFLPPGSARKADFELRINNVATSSGTAISAAQLAIISTHCGNPNFNPSQFRDCYMGKTLFGTPGTENKEWLIYKTLYLKTKNRVLSNSRNAAIAGAGGFNNRSIGGTRDVAANILYAGKRRVFKEEDDIMDETGVEFSGEEPTVEELTELSNSILHERYMDCGVCPLSIDLTILLNSLAYEKKLLTPSLSLPGVSPLILTRNIVSSFPNPTALQYNWTLNDAASSNTLNYKIKLGGAEMCKLTLQKTKSHLQWDSIVMFDCITATGEFTFTLRAIFKNDSIDILNCSSTCFRLQGCTFNRSCTSLPAKRDMLTFMQYLFTGNRYQRTGLTVYRPGMLAHHFGIELRRQNQMGNNWVWNFSGYSSATRTSCTARVSITTPTRVVDCPFTFTVVEPGFSLDSVGYVISIRKPRTALPAADLVNEGEMLVRSKGGRLFTIRFSSCYPLFNCPATVGNRPPRPEMCCATAPHSIWLTNDCVPSLRLIARREAERDFVTRRDRAVDSLRSAYIRHCLESVRETFTVNYNDGFYMVTLYYYNQSGALVKTVPPKGVGAAGNSHTLTTKYEYNSYGSVVKKSAPDEGITNYSYDYAGRSLLSQNSHQRENSTASFALYDKANRMMESGRANNSGAWQIFRDYESYASSLTGKAEVTVTNYDAPAYTFYGGFTQLRLRNRPAVVTYQNAPPRIDYAAGYSYDALGNVTEVRQTYPVLGLSEARATKSIEYEYDKLNGKITRTIYQRAKPDQFIQYVNYDASKRVREVQTTTSVYTPAHLRETEARFNYYQHGPLARTEIGSEQIQGLDYAYTIQGWLKGINSYNTSGTENLDMGNDGAEDGSLHYGHSLPDVMGQVLNYYEGDYRKISGDAVAFYPESPVTADFSKPLYSGNIQNSMMSVNDSRFGSRTSFTQAYSYDQASRLRQSRCVFGGALSTNYAMTLDYDLNGNIQSLMRTNGTGAVIDNQTYNYLHPDLNNMLDYVYDPTGNHGGDLKVQTGGNYIYDVLGRLVRDASEEISAIRYNNKDKVIEVVKDRSGSSTYRYDAFGRRISKTSGSNTEWYVNDALGNQLAVYNINGSEVRWNEAVIYAGKRIGIYKPEVLDTPRVMMRDILMRGMRSYEMANHIGDVLAVVSDKRNVVSGIVKADIQAAHNYYPFGMAMAERTFGNNEYRYGFQGMETEDNLRGENNSYTTEFRQYDPRLCRWLSVDPKAEKYADVNPYTAFNNKPVSVFDAKGDTVATVGRAGWSYGWSQIVEDPWRELDAAVDFFLDREPPIVETRRERVDAFNTDLQRAIYGARAAVTVVAAIPNVSASDAVHLLEFSEFLETFGDYAERLTTVINYTEVLERLAQIRQDIRLLPRAGDPRLRTAAGRQEAAAIWGRLVSNIGELGQDILPEFMAPYAEFLSEMEDFFTNVLPGVDPDSRPRERRMGFRETGVIVDPETGRREDERTETERGLAPRGGSSTRTPRRTR